MLLVGGAGLFRGAPQSTKASAVAVVPTSSLSFAPHRPPVQWSRPAILLNVKAPCGLRGLKSTYSSSHPTSTSSCYRVLLKLLLRNLSALIGCVPCLHIRLPAMALESDSRLMFVSSSCLDELSASSYLYWSCQGCPSASLRCWSDFLLVFLRSRPDPMILLSVVIVR